MNFENFRIDIETKLNSITDFEILEFHYHPYSFGNGQLAYGIKGKIHKFIYDGRDNILTWLIGKKHEKYFGARLTEYNTFNGLIISEEELMNGIKNCP